MVKGMARFAPHNRWNKDKWSVAVYVRLSNEDRDKKNDTDLSQSIINQTDFLKTALDTMNQDADEVCGAQLYKVYCDDDFSGMNFERKGFLQMMTDIKAGLVDCIIVKNLSRLGRYDTKMLQYLEQEFEQEGREVRFIAVGDNYDSLYMELDVITKFKLLMNRDYSETQHKNVSIGMHTMQRQGKFIGAFAPYGYVKDAQDKHKLVADPVAAAVVKRIYKLYAEGISPREIAKILNQDGIVNRSAYKRLHGSNFSCNRKISKEETRWTKGSVRQVLTNEIYTGMMVQHKQEKKRLLDKKPKKLPKEQWYRRPDMHEAIIPRDLWDSVQNMMDTTGHDTAAKVDVTIFKGLLRCGDCRRAMRKKWENYTRKDGIQARYLYYNCSTFRDYGSTDKTGAGPPCTCHYVSDKLIRRVVLHDINKIIAAIHNLEEMIREQKEKQGEDAMSGVSLIGASQCQKRLEILEKRRRNAKDKWLDGKLSDEEYEEIKRICDEQIDGITAEIKMLEESAHRTQGLMDSPWIRCLLEKGEIEELDRRTVVELIEGIYIYENKTIEIVYNFSDGLDALFLKEIQSTP